MFNSTLVLDPGRPDPVKLSAPSAPLATCRKTSWSTCSTAATAKWTASRTSPTNSSGRHAAAGPACRRSANWVHSKVRFDYASARPTKTAMDVFTERVGVCRDFQHLAVTFCRAMNIPARYATGYLGDIGVPVVRPHGLQRLVRGLPRQIAGGPSMRVTTPAHWPRSHGNGPRRLRCSPHHVVWASRPMPLLCSCRGRKGQPGEGHSQWNARTGGRGRLDSHLAA